MLELGVLEDIRWKEDQTLHLELIPTFAGCPAIEWMRQEVEWVLKNNGFLRTEIVINKNRPWTSDRISEEGKSKLLDFGLSPPPPVSSDGLELDLKNALCPHCRSINTRLLSPFGPTLCRAIHHCDDCNETFEQFKPL